MRVKANMNYEKMHEMRWGHFCTNLIKSCVFIAGLLLICKVLNYMYVSPDYDYRTVMHNMYNTEGIDSLYLGSSHVYSGINPTILDELNGETNFDLATAGQRMNGSYYLLKEAAKKNELSHVYLEVFYMRTVQDNFNGDIDPIDEKLYFNEQVADNMKISANKLAYIVSSAGIEAYGEFFFPFSRYQRYYLDFGYIKDNVMAKNGDMYLQYKCYGDYADGNGKYELLDNNFYSSTREFLDETRFAEQFRVLDEEPIGEKSEKYLMRIIQYCKQHDIELTLYIPPVDDLYLICTENYDNYLKQIKRITDENGLEFYDFNLAKEQYLSIPREGFSDYAHTNDLGASIFTSFFWKVMSGNPEEVDQYFYSNYEEKLASLQPAIYGLYYWDTYDEEGEKRNVKIASNRKDGVEYQIIMTPDNEESYMLQDFSENNIFAITPQDHGICTVHMRNINTSEIMQTQTIRY